MHLVDATHHQAESRADIARTAALKTMGKMREAERRVKLGPNAKLTGPSENQGSTDEHH